MRHIGRIALALACAGLVSVPAPAGAAWPQQGGDPGRPGYQPLSDGTKPVDPVWAAPGDVTATAPVITDGALEEQRVAYGTADGRVHVRRLDTGAPVGPAEGVDVGGLGPSFAVTGTRIHVLHNGASVMLATIDASTGTLLSDRALPGTGGLRASGPAVAAAGALLFVATDDAGAGVLVRVRLADGDVAAVPVPGASAVAGPSIAWLASRGGPHAVVGDGNRLRTFSVERFPEEGPSSSPLEGPPGAVAVPAGSGTAAPVLVTALASAGGTRVVRIADAPGGLAVEASSALLPGLPAPALAVAQEVVGGELGNGWIVVGTTVGLHVLDGRTLGRLSAGLGGPYATAAPAAAGSLAFTVRDDGTPVGLDLVSGDPIDLADDAGTTTTGQPAISRGMVVVSSARGLTAFRTRCGNPRAATRGPDELAGSIAGDVARAGGGNDVLAGGDGDDCLDGGSGRDVLAGDAGSDTLAGGTGGDRIDGGDGDDRVFGLDGRDRLAGGAGNDRVAGGRGADSLSGDDGDDRLNSRGGGRDRLRCGPGRDRALADRADRVAGDCERVLRR